MNIVKEGALDDPTKEQIFNTIYEKGCSYVAMFSIRCSAVLKVECGSLMDVPECHFFIFSFSFLKANDIFMIRS